MGKVRTKEYQEGVDKYLKVLYGSYTDIWVYRKKLSDAAWELRLIKEFVDDGET